MEYGHDKVQGVDYAYTLQGWIKGVNSNKLSPNQDIGHDGTAGLNNLFATDAFGYTLGYYNATSSDYTPISSSVWTSANRFEAFIGNSSNPSSLFSSRNDLFNGNISYLATTIPEPLNLNGATPAPGTVLTGKPLASGFRYDQLSRIVNAESFEDFRSANNDWLANGPGRYQNTFTYDANGNITALTRNDQTGTLFDDLTYHYPLDGQNRPVNNRMTQITDAVTTSSIPDEFESGQTANNYWYDGMGNLFSDEAAEMWIYGGGGYSWYMNGKLKEARHNLGSSKKNLKFDYDPQGNRIAKHIYTSTWVWEKSIYHVRDATGNILATYEHFIDQQGGSPQIKYVIKERPIIGSGRIGLDVHESDIAYDYQAIQPTVPTPVSHGRFVGRKLFELTNHLGNVNAIVTDVKVPVPVTTNYQNTSISYYLSDVGSSIDYYPGGMMMPGRQFDSGDYRYGFNGKEYDNEVKGTRNQLDYGMRIYDPRLVRFLSVDPMAYQREWLSPFNFVQNNPINRVDPTGAIDNPIYDEEGNFLGTDDNGLQGEAIVMKKEVFKQGMPQEDALIKGKLLSDVPLVRSPEFFDKIETHKASLVSRPDWDGHLTLAETNEWYREGKGKPLYADLAKVDLSGIFSLGENYVGQVKSFNLLLNSRSLNDGLVYGSITLKRYPNHYVRAFADEYNFEMHNP